MAIALEIGISDLIAEFLTHTFIVFRLLQTARTIAVLHLQAFAHAGNDLFVFVQSDCHTNYLPFLDAYSIP